MPIKTVYLPGSLRWKNRCECVCVFLLITTRDKQAREVCPCRVSRHFLSCRYLASAIARINRVRKQMSVNENRTKVLDQTVPLWRCGQAYSAGHALSHSVWIWLRVCVPLPTYQVTGIADLPHTRVSTELPGLSGSFHMLWWFQQQQKKALCLGSMVCLMYWDISPHDGSVPKPSHMTCCLHR